MVEVFKSPVNLQKCAEARVVAISGDTQTDANSSIVVPYAFPKPFNCIPVVTCTIVCADKKFELNYNLGAVRPDGFDFHIENLADSARVFRVAYRAEAPTA